MYVFVDKKTRALLHIAAASQDDSQEPAAVYGPYDPATMDVGRASDGYVPVRFEIRKGVVVDLDPPPAETLVHARQRKIDEINATALTLRGALAPDYQLLNAGLGLYDDARVQQLRDTVNAFRAEVLRAEGLVKAARSIKDVDAVQPAFPSALVEGDKPKPVVKAKSRLS